MENTPCSGSKASSRSFTACTRFSGVAVDSQASGTGLSSYMSPPMTTSNLVALALGGGLSTS
eukprot:1296545-Heterocapsa_arctica.AAC.1